ncbi:glycosyltransferase [Schinkia azotoformans]|uniref:Glycosyltransferase n=1 Tax=Schinkia azotoformans LMG 9581 TaxID=1131731 RepID=K6D402_SCHAZ|nr:glycosyltransferase [Schinkia azotoformans]EKN62793.1 glycosyltransferase [Schinkia azotoformans LMG 9581]MEC1639168.1 glycosyltransferase [Schinkia azotoformans]MEC1945756.1 glycosyltransferase [Schinkia azotoformans]
MNNIIKLSVLLVTYNHEKYIKEAMDSILLQQLDYDYEIVVADDCSTDDTLNIIKEYKKQYPDKIRILDGEKNLGITKNYKRGFNACKGEYIAVLEGDDYWTSPQKLNKQVNVLDNNKNCVLAFNRFTVMDVGTKRYNIQPWPSQEPFQLVTVTDLVRDNFIGNFSTCVYRADIIRKLDDSLFEFTVYDWMLNIVVAQFGLIAYVPEVMSVYRLHSSGTWSNKNQVEKIQDTIKLIDEYNAYLNYVYNLEFTEHKNRLLQHLNGLLNPAERTTKEKAVIKVKEYLPPFVIVLLKSILPPKLLNRFKVK